MCISVHSGHSGLLRNGIYWFIPDRKLFLPLPLLQYGPFSPRRGQRCFAKKNTDVQFWPPGMCGPLSEEWPYQLPWAALSFFLACVCKEHANQTKTTPFALPTLGKKPRESSYRPLFVCVTASLYTEPAPPPFTSPPLPWE